MAPRVPIEERRNIIRYFLEGIPREKFAALLIDLGML